MGETSSAAKARMELEELYLGIPDESVNLTFQDLADMKLKANANASDSQKKKSVEAIQEAKTTPNPKQVHVHKPPLTKLPSLDFNRGLQATKDHTPNYHQRHHLHYRHQNDDDYEYDYEDDNFDSHMDMGHHHHHRHHHHHDVGNMHAIAGAGAGTGRGDFHRYGGTGGGDQSNRSHTTSPGGRAEFRHGLDSHRSVAFDDVSVVSMASNYTERGQRRRPGIPHSNICTICCNYIYIFRHRCLVCGRVYCRQCVFMGMGEMTEGRKCILCLGRRFSQRYIKRSGKMGCFSRYPSSVKEAELKWAEKGPRRNGERAYGGQSTMTMNMMSRSRSPINPSTPTTRTTHNNNNANIASSFVATSPAYSLHTTPHHHLPL